MMQKVEITHLDGSVEYAQGDDIKISNDCLHVWNRHYNTGLSFLADEHAGSFPLVSIKRWRIING